MPKLHAFYDALSQEAGRVSESLSRYYARKARQERILCQNLPVPKDEKPSFERCNFCCNKFTKDNHRIKMVPKLRLTAKIKRLLAQNEASLGKYQRKVVQDYINGANKLVITCHVCKKTMKTVGQSRVQKQVMRDKMLHQQTSQAAVMKPKTKSEKKKEKRKLQKKKRQNQVEETNAGLTIPISTIDSSHFNMDTRSNIEENELNNKEGESGDGSLGEVGSGEGSSGDVSLGEVGLAEVSSDEGVSQTSDRSDILRVSDTMKPTSSIHSEKRTMASRSNTNCSVKSQQGSVSNHSAKVKLTPNVNNRGSFKLASNVDKSSPLKTVEKTSNKKKKTMKITQQLSNMLKKGSTSSKPTGGSLTDFLSNL